MLIAARIFGFQDSEEQVIDFGRLWNWMKFFDFKVRGFTIGETDGKLVFEKGYHASGHASAAELHIT